MSMRFAKLADRLAKYYLPSWNPPKRDDIRDWVDMDSGGDLDAVQLDILTDMVIKRLSDGDIK
jgi:hypothetical protein